MMISPAVVYLLISALLFGVAVVVHYHSAALSLPVSPAISILATILPIAGFLNAYIHPNMLRTAHASHSRIPQLGPFVLQTLQALVATVLATLLLERVVPSQGLECALDARWMNMFRAHDASRIRRIQDALDCCGLNSVKDRAYPFPKSGVSTCAETYGRDRACRGPWKSALQSTAGVDFAVVIAVALLQLGGLFMMREGNSWWTAWRTRGSGLVNGDYGSRRPLLTAAEEGDEEETVQQRSSGYGGINRVTDMVNGEESSSRVEPSRINERNAWTEE